jgi:hypothetical protein
MIKDPVTWKTGFVVSIVISRKPDAAKLSPVMDCREAGRERDFR